MKVHSLQTPAVMNMLTHSTWIQTQEYEGILAFCSADTKLCEWYYILSIGIYVYMYVGSHAWAYMCLCRDMHSHITQLHMYVYIHECMCHRMNDA